MAGLQHTEQVGRQTIEFTSEDRLTDYKKRINSRSLGNRDLRASLLTNFKETVRLACRTSPVDRTDAMIYLESFSTEYRNRYLSLMSQERQQGMTSRIFFIEEAISITKASLSATPEHYLERASLLHDLSKQLSQSHRVARQIVDITPLLHNQAEVFDDLGNKLFERFEKTGNETDLDEAIQYARQAVDVAPSQHLDYSMYLNNLGAKLGRRFQKTEVKADLEKGIQFVTQAVDTASPDDPNQAHYLSNLAVCYYGSFIKGNITDLNQAISIYQSALSHRNARIFDRIRAGVCLMMIQSCSNWQQAFDTASLVMCLVPMLAQAPSRNFDKQHLLREVSGVACSAAAAALQAKQAPLIAVSLLEQGRCVFVASLREAGGDIFELRERRQELVQRFLDVRAILEHLVASNVLSRDDIRRSSMNPQGNPRYNTGTAIERPKLLDRTTVQGMLEQLVSMNVALRDELLGGPDGSRTNRGYAYRMQFENILIEIRREPGFESFWLPPNEAEIQNAAKDGPIALINVSEWGSDALLVEQDQVRSLALPGLSMEAIKGKVREGNLGSPQVLEWLWDTLGGPVLDALGFTGPLQENNWPRVWWIPTGPLSLFPLHAAGYHSRRSYHTVLDRVMSSYSTSIRAIINGRRRRVTSSSSTQALVIAMEHTPESSRLPFAANEIAAVRSLCRSMELDPIEPGRRREDIMPHLRDCKIFHFAGHGYTDLRDPLNSHLRLEDWKKDPLRVDDLLEIDLREPSPFLAYLSACGTGRVKDKQLIDESIHLISACQLAGFRHVVGTLWEVSDELCVDMARITYEGIRDGGMTDESVCQGLHTATREFRGRWLNDLTKVRPGCELVRTGDTSLMSVGADVKSAKYEGHKADRSPRKAEIQNDAADEDGRPPLWVPYVHFGV